MVRGLLVQLSHPLTIRHNFKISGLTEYRDLHNVFRLLQFSYISLGIGYKNYMLHVIGPIRATFHLVCLIKLLKIIDALTATLLRRINFILRSSKSINDFQ